MLELLERPIDPGARGGGVSIPAGRGGQLVFANSHNQFQLFFGV